MNDFKPDVSLSRERVQFFQEAKLKSGIHQPDKNLYTPSIFLIENRSEKPREIRKDQRIREYKLSFGSYFQGLPQTYGKPASRTKEWLQEE